MHRFSPHFLRMTATAFCVLLSATGASAAVVASANMAVSATVLPICATSSACTAGSARTEQVVAFSATTGGNAADPAPASAQVHRMLVISY